MLNYYFSNYLFFLLKVRKKKKFTLNKTSICVVATLLIFSINELSAQSKAVSGVVTTSDSGMPLPGATVMVKGTSNGTLTDFDGNYSLKINSANPTLVFSYLGYVSQEVLVGGKTTISVVLQADQYQLDEVVLVDYGYGKVKKSDMTGAVSSISSKELAKIPVASVTEALSGRLSGVNITPTDGEPGSDVQIRIRGGGSITQDNSPLYVVDGFIVDGISDIPPNDIEDINILKDAAATAVYGAQAANGVIVVTTKSPVAGKVSVNYNNFLQINTLPSDRRYEVLSPYEFVLANYEYAALQGDAAVRRYERYFGKYQDIDIYQNKKPTDWQEELFGAPRISTYHNLSVNGGTDLTKMRLSVSRNDDQGLLTGSAYERTAINFKVNQEISKNLHLDLNARITNSVRDGAGTSTNAQLKIKDAVQTRPVNGIADDLDIDLNSPNSDDEYQQFLLSLVSPTELVKQDWRKRTDNDYVLNAGLTWQIIKGLSLKTNYSTSNTFREELRFYGPLTGESFNNGGSMPLGQKTNSENTSYRITNSLNFKKTWNDDYKLDLLVGHEVYSKGGKDQFLRAEDFRLSITPEELFGNMNLGRVDRQRTRIFTESNRLSVFGRADLQIKNKYMATVTFRGDESSKFSKENRLGIFPALALGWKISEEEFLKDSDFVNQLKLRVSYGETGNDRVDATATQYALTPETNRGPGFGNVDNIYYRTTSDVLYNPDLVWETTISRNIGLDFTLFNRRINGSLEAYKNSTRDLLLENAISSNSGFNFQWANIGSTSNKGIEFNVDAYLIDTNDFSLSASFNIGKNNFVIDDLGNVNERFERSNWASTDLNNINDYYLKIGGKVGDIYGYVTDGMYTVDDFESYDPVSGDYTLKPGITNSGDVVGRGSSNIRPGFLKLKNITSEDTNNDGVIDENDTQVINADDRRVIGNALPDFQGGFGFNSRYKGFDMSIFFNYQVGNDVYNASKIQYTQFRRVSNGNMLDMMNSSNRFTYIDTNGTYGEPGSVVTDLTQLGEMNQGKTMWSHASHGIAGAVVHDWAIEDGSFLRLNNLTFGYSLPKKVAAKAGMSKFRIFVTGRNLHLWSKYTGYDPEVNSNNRNGLTPGLDNSSYPRSRSYTVGLNVTF